MIDIERVFKKTLRQWGHNILLQRRLDDNMKYSSKVEKITTRRSSPRLRSAATTLQEQVEGLVEESDMLYYFESSVNPKSGDRIYEDYPKDNRNVYLVDQAIPVYGKYGKIAYWVVGASQENV
jgi:hypothetical protein